MKSNRVNVWGVALLAAGVATAVTVAACGKSSKKSDNPAPGGGNNETGSTEKAEGAGISISGALNLTGTSTGLNLAQSADAVALTDLKIYCVTFSSPPVAGEGSVDADGKFALTLAAAQQAVGCFILKNDEQLGTIVFKDPSKKSLSGTAKSSQRQAFGDDTDLGTITLDLATGEAVVDVTQITTKKNTETANDTAAAYDFTGTYTMSAVDFELPKGYSSVCDPNEDKQNSNCRGPRDGERIWFKRVNGKFVADGKPAYGIMIWESEDAFKACGSKLGFSYQEGKDNAGVDLSESGIAEGLPTFVEGWVDGWKSPTARLKWNQMKMERATIGGYSGNKQYFTKYRTCTWSQGSGAPTCTETVANGYSFFVNSAETGCKIGGKPFRLEDWRDMRCEGSALEGGLNKNTCTKTVTEGEVSCVNISGQFLADNTAIARPQNGHIEIRFPQDYVTFGRGLECSNGKFPQGDGKGGMSCPAGSTVTYAGDLCKDMPSTTEPEKLAQLRCYADGYWSEAKEQGNQGKCVRKIRTNFNAATVAEFLPDDGPAKAEAQFIFEGFEYDSPNSGSFRNTERYFEGIKAGDSWDDCEVQESTTFSMRKKPDSTDVIVEMITETRNLSSKPSCLAEFENNGGNVQTSKSMFLMKK